MAEQSQTPTPQTDQSAPGASNRASRFASDTLSVLRRVPFTASVVLTITVVGIATGALWNHVRTYSWFNDIAYGVPALQEGKWWTLVTGWFFGLTPGQYVSIIVVFAFAVGWCEWRLGTKNAAIVTISGQLAGELGASLLLWAGSHTDWDWARNLATHRDVGVTTAIIAALAATTATLRSPWRMRVRAILCAYIAIAFLFEGRLADVQHLIAVAIFLPVGEKFFGDGERGFIPRTRREIRLLGFIGLLLIGVVEIAVWLFPGSGPFGPTEAETGSGWTALIDVVIVALIADQLRRGRRWAWWVAVVFGSLTVLATALVLVSVIFFDYESAGAVTVGTALLWLLELILLIKGRHAFHVPMRRKIRGGPLSGNDPRAAARELLKRHGGGTMSWMTTWDGNSYYFGESGESVVAFQRHVGVVVVLADPIANPDRLAAAVDEFTTMSEANGLTPCLFSVGKETADAATRRGWRTVQVAEDTIVDLPELQFTGKSWQDIRSALNKAKKDDITFRMTTLADEPFSVLAQVRAISEEWVGDKGLPEMGFTLGSVEEALDRDVRVGLAVDPTGSIHGVTSWLPVYGEGGVVQGWTLDVMRRRPDGFRPVVEFLIASSALEFKEQGAQFVSLSGAPLARSDDGADAASMDRLLDMLGAAMEPLYGFRSLHAFKKKFKPRYEPVFLCFRDEADLPRIGIALTRAYLPDATAPQLIKLATSKS
ncbi:MULTISPECIES: bifunctional lysylphosphatidylglycerol flippase/synthetase MprF [Rhodococcus]|uniref:bifunctional lysylphosphatidylglycerol flippase/synthetase MprF n=1 Tax=Rhodococcus TaxID=1827 RepID=UPI0004A8A2CF|nr:MULTISPECIES: DUF2156 domain-containing protein [Rhodococcus]KDQ01614.1 membrane protein [Rhodococcus qingshengii]MBP2523155.1 lysylphosphatidylglycerol synthetase-like protein (DUF2156 family) [Rhodococcus sp. PvP104]MBT9296438.1 DUF2156 domain-containing protein [Rhodococcus sp. GOMB7]MDA3631352.1 DUF2156 domain-containing protein [Rhodococcus sp. C-2]MDI9959949.1 DUF2156 domain-containing protein [Rhodococcus sp. IEGM 1237]